jgi:hypothetical protein
MTLVRLSLRQSLAVGIALLACGTVAGASAAPYAETAPEARSMVRRLSQEQYRNIIADVFGPTVKVGGRFEPDIRRDGLLAVGASAVSVTASGLEDYDQIARSIASQVVSEERRGTLFACKPAKATEPDDACAKQFLGDAGRLLYRRALSSNELKTRVKVAHDAGAKLKDFYQGVGVSLSTMLTSPLFLFRQDVAEALPGGRGQYRLDGYSKASQLSFLLWNAGPDPELLTAAEKGELHTEAGLAKQVDRMLASPRLSAGVRAFFTDMLGFDEFQNLAKDALLFPKYTSRVAVDAQEQTLRTITDVLVTQKADYRDIFTTRKTYLTPQLASIYGVPLPATDNGWKPYEYAEGDPRVGVAAQISFVALHSHPGRSSPTLRGKAIRQVLLCQKVPDPPGNVNFTVVQDTKNPQYKTARERLSAHATEAMCTGCHKLIDPIGFGLEQFDSAGSLRETENGARIDTQGELDGIKFTNAAGLANALHEDPAAVSCIVDRVYAYAAGHAPAKSEAGVLESLRKDFAADQYRFPALLRRIALNETTSRVAPPQMGALETPARTLASNTNSTKETQR